jgi:hypothetical protein
MRSGLKTLLSSYKPFGKRLAHLGKLDDPAHLHRAAHGAVQVSLRGDRLPSHKASPAYWRSPAGFHHLRQDFSPPARTPHLDRLDDRLPNHDVREAEARGRRISPRAGEPSGDLAVNFAHRVGG